MQNPTSPGRCSNNACVDANVVDGGVTVTSTIDGNDGRATFTHAEWSTFLDAVKAGAWDHTYRQVPVNA